MNGVWDSGMAPGTAHRGAATERRCCRSANRRTIDKTSAVQIDPGRDSSREELHFLFGIMTMFFSLGRTME